MSFLSKGPATDSHVQRGHSNPNDANTDGRIPLHNSYKDMQYPWKYFQVYCPHYCDSGLCLWREGSKDFYSVQLLL